MPKYLKIYFILVCVIFCQKGDAQLADLYNCKVKPIFLSRPEINLRVYAISTSNRFYKGLTVINGDTANMYKTGKKIYQHESWKKHGSLGSFILTERGDIFVIPVPSINVLENPKQDQQTIYRVDAITGIMQAYFQLPAIDTPSPENPFGLMSLAYDCTTKLLYASSVYASTRVTENGIVYVIDTKQKKPVIIDSLTGTDVLGLYIGMLNGKKICFFSSARKSFVSAISLDSSGKFITAERSVIISLENHGPRGDDKVRKIKISEGGILTLYGVAFNWNLTAPTEKQESEYNYIYDPRLNRLVLRNTYSQPVALGYKE